MKNVGRLLKDGVLFVARGGSSDIPRSVKNKVLALTGVLWALLLVFYHFYPVGYWTAVFAGAAMGLVGGMAGNYWEKKWVSELWEARKINGQ